MTTKRSIKRAQPEETPAEQRQPFTGLQVALVLNDNVAATAAMPLAESYAESEKRLQEMMASIRDTLARLYEDRMRQSAEYERQRADRLAAELDALRSQVAGTKEET